MKKAKIAFELIILGLSYCIVSDIKKCIGELICKPNQEQI